MSRDKDELKFGPLPAGTAHVCVDMQRLFAEGSEWETPWLRRVLPKVRQIVEDHAKETIFTRFIPAKRPGEGHGSWSRYYERWASMTLQENGREPVELIPELAEFVPPAQQLDKHVYSPWEETKLHHQLKERGVEALVVSGGETDVCVLATVLGAVDRGYRVVVASDALCSSSDETHDALLKLYRNRYGQQIECAETDAILRQWRT